MKRIVISAMLFIAATALSHTQIVAQNINNKNSGTFEILLFHFPDSVVFKPLAGVSISSSKLSLSFVSDTESYTPKYIISSGRIGLNFDGSPNYDEQTILIVKEITPPADFTPQKIRFTVAGNMMFYDIAKSEWEYPEFLKKYHKLTYRDDGFIMVKLDNKTGLVDSKGKEVLPCKYLYDEIGVFENGTARVEFSNKYGYINENGVEVIPCKYDKIGNFSNGVAMVKINGKVGVIDKQGKEVLPCKYDYDQIDYFSNGLARVKSGDKYGYINESGVEVIPCKYNTLYHLGDGLYLAGLGEKRGLFESSGKEVVPLFYDELAIIRQGIIRVKLDDKYGYIDKNGNELVPCKFDQILFFDDGYSQVLLDKRWGVINNQNGQQIILCKYEKMGKNGSKCFSNDIVRVLFNDKLLFVDKQGNEYSSEKKALKAVKKMRGE